MVEEKKQKKIFLFGMDLDSYGTEEEKRVIMDETAAEILVTLDDEYRILVYDKRNEVKILDA